MSKKCNNLILIIRLGSIPKMLNLHSSTVRKWTWESSEDRNKKPTVRGLAIFHSLISDVL